MRQMRDLAGQFYEAVETAGSVRLNAQLRRELRLALEEYATFRKVGGVALLTTKDLKRLKLLASKFKESITVTQKLEVRHVFWETMQDWLDLDWESMKEDLRIAEVDCRELVKLFGGQGR